MNFMSRHGGDTIKSRISALEILFSFFQYVLDRSLRLSLAYAGMTEQETFYDAIKINRSILTVNERGTGELSRDRQTKGLWE
jgi:hypothetical protein